MSERKRIILKVKAPQSEYKGLQNKGGHGKAAPTQGPIGRMFNEPKFPPISGFPEAWNLGTWKPARWLLYKILICL